MASLIQDLLDKTLQFLNILDSLTKRKDKSSLISCSGLVESRILGCQYFESSNIAWAFIIGIYR